MKHKRSGLLFAAGCALVGVIGAMLVFFGNPKNMGFCIACFLRDTAGALKLHGAGAVQYVRPEIIGLVLGSFAVSLIRGEFRPRGGSSPMTRFVLGFCVMTGCLMFLGCPFRAALRLAGGDLNALCGFAGFALGILAGVFFLQRGFSLRRTYALGAGEGAAFPAVQAGLLCLTLFFSGLLAFSESGPGSMRAPLVISLAAGLAVGAIAQRTRLCMMGGFRDLILFRDTKLIGGFGVVILSAFVTNLILTAATGAAFVRFSFEGQPVAHTDALWNILGMTAVGFGSALLGGCPLRQLVMAGEGNSDGAVTVIGMVTGAAFCHNFSLASSADGPTANGKIAVVTALAVMLAIALLNTRKEKGE